MALSGAGRKKIYDKTAKLIIDLEFQDKLSLEEMNFLLNFLDLIYFGKIDTETVKFLRIWAENNSDSEIDEIIKATLVGDGLKDPQNLSKNIAIIKELLGQE